ncbi:hypothetical protein TeGR_g9659 [Tetraparma gracilis]|uniref:non-specific serine/threonine protein kinase n=1 Tax=Tetraparma gracilis TaxID=2962635 RepID=A0ABQ6MLP6_9STRA|nr:hypothetical protein TeGR_g9659 [Tetraparma gracilis]
MQNYEVLSHIGKGSFGRVSKIRRKADDKELVWKELQYGTMNEKEKQQIVAEVNILRELRHPCIVRYYDRIIDKKATKLYIVMEHCSGGDLASLIRSHAKNKTRADEGFIWKVLGQVVSALKSCHRHREGGEAKPILHRDLKPANILLDRNGNAKLCDFGLATELAGTNKLAQTAGVGTPYYMSPELVNSQRYDERSDIWSVGCIIYELAALRPPFDAPNQLALAVKINEGKFKRLPAVFSDELERTCGWMLRRDISRRPRVEDLERLPHLVLPLREARVGMKEIEVANQQAKVARDQRAAEERLREREKELGRREEEVRKREEQLTKRMAEVTMREKRLALPPPPPASRDAQMGGVDDAENDMAGLPPAPPAAANPKKRTSAGAGFRIPLVAAETAGGAAAAAGAQQAPMSTRNAHHHNDENAANAGNAAGGEFEAFQKRRRVVAGGGGGAQRGKLGMRNAC